MPEGRPAPEAAVNQADRDRELSLKLEPLAAAIDDVLQQQSK
jgi:hypothetical protein